MGRLTDQTRAQKEASIRAAMDRLLRGEIPPGGKCDVKTLAASSGITRAALYSTYLHLKEEFEQRRDHLRATGVISDSRDAQIERLKQRVKHLENRVAVEEQRNADLAAFRVQSVSRLAAQYDEITRLRGALPSSGTVRSFVKPNEVG